MHEEHEKHEKDDWIYRLLDCSRNAAYVFNDKSLCGIDSDRPSIVNWI